MPLECQICPTRHPGKWGSHEFDRVRAGTARDLRLNHPEATAILTAFVLDGARDGRTVTELMVAGREVLTRDDVLPGVPEMLESVQVEATFRDGTKLVTIHGPHPMIPGEIVTPDETITLNPGRDRIELVAENTGDRPVQVGSRYHLAAANPALAFDRAAARGYRLDIPAGTSVRFEPGMTVRVALVAIAGTRTVPGLRPE